MRAAVTHLSTERSVERRSRFFAVLSSFCCVHSLKHHAGVRRQRTAGRASPWHAGRSSQGGEDVA